MNIFTIIGCHVVFWCFLILAGLIFYGLYKYLLVSYQESKLCSIQVQIKYWHYRNYTLTYKSTTKKFDKEEFKEYLVYCKARMDGTAQGMSYGKKYEDYSNEKLQAENFVDKVLCYLPANIHFFANGFFYRIAYANKDLEIAKEVNNMIKEHFSL